jgi:hypothetical protein
MYSGNEPGRADDAVAPCSEGRVAEEATVHKLAVGNVDFHSKMES